MIPTSPCDLYRGARLSLLTKHGKERLLAPLFGARLHAHLELATGFDTDTFGTFTREVPRLVSQLETARKKAEKGMELLALDRGVASEGSFGPGPYGFCALNVELVVLVDRVLGLEIVGRAQGPARHLHERVCTAEALAAFARRAGFPEHGLVMRPDGESHPAIRKEITSWPALHQAFASAQAEARSSSVFVENDLRAHRNPTRRQVIREAAGDLIDRVQSACPWCRAPGYWRVERYPGLPCAECRAPTEEARKERWACLVADHSELRDVGSDRFADPLRCGRCNP